MVEEEPAEEEPAAEAESEPAGDRTVTLTSWGGAYQESQQRAYVEPYIELNSGVTATWDSSSNEAVAKLWMQYVKDTAIEDKTPPPSPTDVKVDGNKIRWSATADLESGLAHFIIRRDGKFLTKVPQQGKNRFGRPIFQNLQYSDTPTQPLVLMQYTDDKAEPGKKHIYQVLAVNTVGLKSRPTPKTNR